MLKYSIKKKYGFLAAMENLGERWRNGVRVHPEPANRLPAIAGPAVGGTLQDEMDMPWNKIDYSRWYDINVMGRFKVGDLVTPHYMAEQVGFLPYHWKITYCNELHHTVKFSRSNDQPKCIIVQNLQNGFTSKCPKELRLLTEKEIALVNLQNIKVQGTA